MQSKALVSLKLQSLELKGVETPAYVLDESLLLKNVRILDQVRRRTGCRVILALKAFSMFGAFPLIAPFLDGTTASSLNEARLGAEEFGKEVHVYAPAYREEEIAEIARLAGHISFNSFSQWHRFKDVVKQANPAISCGLRLNPEHSEVETALYDPCAPYSRLGITRKEFRPDELAGIDGFHFHTLCEKNVDSLARTLTVFEVKFGKYFKKVKWVNFGGGHHITRRDYDLDTLCAVITDFQERHRVQVILEPGEAVALNAGYLVASVLDITRNEKQNVILDVSATAHMPDVLEMPYRPEIVGAGEPGEYAYTYRFGGPTCLSGDFIGEYSFEKPLAIGDQLIFCDMGHYTMVKNTTFNGIPLPAIALRKASGDVVVLRKFGYEDFRNRLS